VLSSPLRNVGGLFVVSPICVMESIPLLSNLHESSFLSLVVCSLSTQCKCLLSIFVKVERKALPFLQRSFTKSAKLNWSHFAWTLAHSRAPFTQRMTCFCSWVVIHTYLRRRHVYYQLWKWVTLNCFVIWKKRRAKTSSQILHFEGNLNCFVIWRKRRGKYHSKSFTFKGKHWH
jgi:hypothetical protein